MEKDNLEFKDDFIESIVKKANRKVLNEDFEKQLMNTIIERQAYKRPQYGYIN